MKDKTTTMNLNYAQANPYQVFKLLSINEARIRLVHIYSNELLSIQGKDLKEFSSMMVL